MFQVYMCNIAKRVYSSICSVMNRRESVSILSDEKSKHFTGLKNRFEVRLIIEVLLSPFPKLSELMLDMGSLH